MIPARRIASIIDAAESEAQTVSGFSALPAGDSEGRLVYAIGTDARLGTKTLRILAHVENIQLDNENNFVGKENFHIL